MIIVTGAAGFIGSCVAKWYASQGQERIVAVDHFEDRKAQNLEGFDGEKVERDVFFDWVKSQEGIRVIIHLGARTDTTEFDRTIFDELNVAYSKQMWELCVLRNIPLVYASSAATYGLGEYGYVDNHSIVSELKPLNPYGESKNDFDAWAIQQTLAPPSWYGLKFFNVYGPNEYHKGRMASVILHAFKQISDSNGVKLFRSHNSDYKDGEQLRDFIYVKDIVSVISFLDAKKPESGLYNLGTGEARPFNALANAVFDALGVPSNIRYIDTPLDIRDKYQYYTQADMTKLRDAGYSKAFTSLEEGVEDYVKNYLVSSTYY